MNQSSWNQNSYLNIKLGEQLSLKAFIFLTTLVKLYLAKMCPIFASSASNCLTRYKQILSGCSLGCKNALNFTCLPMKFHNCVHTNVLWYYVGSLDKLHIRQGSIGKENGKAIFNNCIQFQTGEFKNTASK